jgi:sirohydrochlorin cobaltochelatase
MTGLDGRLDVPGRPGGRAGPALLVAGHGTRDADGVADFGRFIERVRGRVPVTVAGGFIELSPPPLTEVVSGLYRAGHRHVATVPLVLVAAGHGKGDIPGAMARELVRHPGLSYTYGRPLGPHPTLLALLEERMLAALGPVPVDGTTAVLLVGRGSTDPDANAEVHKVARLFWEGRGADGDGGLMGVEPAFVSLARPGVPEGLERLRRLGANRIVVLPYFLFRGVLPDRVADEAREWAAGRTGTEVLPAEVIGDCDGLADVVIERYEEALAGDIRMNCDTCVYRIAMPGFEHRVGAPQKPHDHPEDPTGGHGHGHAHVH